MSPQRAYILGIWDGHDAGAAAVDAATGEVWAAANEERFSRRKLDVGFPERTVRWIVGRHGPPSRIVVPTTDPAKVLARLLPSAARSYYIQRRHKGRLSPLHPIRQAFKDWITRRAPGPVGRFITGFLISWRSDLGRIPVSTMDHHLAHLSAAWFTSGFSASTILSLDGIGDACSGAFGVGASGGAGVGIRVWGRFAGKDSIGLVFEEATRMLHMRELEDEGKVMALAAHADLGTRDLGSLLDLVTVHDGPDGPVLCGRPDMKARLRDALWRLGPERFAAAVQHFAETRVLEVARSAIRATGLPDLAVAGGVFANVRINQRLRDEIVAPAGGRLWVFPHMGDGGLALGAALGAALLSAPGVVSDGEPADPAATRGRSESGLHPFQGDAVDAELVADLARRRGLHVEACALEDVVDRLVGGQAIAWVNGRMEYGPRALGARSILARPDDIRVRDRLNLALKKRVFYQPFCPTMLAEDAEDMLEGFRGEERWMTALYAVRPAALGRLAGVLGPDGSCRPQVLPHAPTTPEEALFRELLLRFRDRAGIGAVLNTSFNVHGDPVPRTESECVEAFLGSGLDALVACGRILVRRPA